MKKRFWRRSLIVLVLLFAAAQMVRPARTNPEVVPARTVAAHLAVPAEVTAVFGRACGDCHSNRTQWPWYSHVAPVSWLVIDDVNDGRRHLNFSEWAGYDRKRAGRQLDEICKEVSSGGMPLRSYRWMHPEAELSPADVGLICDWSREQRQGMAGSEAEAAPNPATTGNSD